MKTIYNKFIPISGYKAINLFGILFVRSGKKMKESDLNHEKIHTAQMKELLYIFFYLIYVFEWLIRILICLFKHNYTKLSEVPHKAYKAIFFEKEAMIMNMNLPIWIIEKFTQCGNLKIRDMKKIKLYWAQLKARWKADMPKVFKRILFIGSGISGLAIAIHVSLMSAGAMEPEWWVNSYPYVIAFPAGMAFVSKFTRDRDKKPKE